MTNTNIIMPWFYHFIQIHFITRQNFWWFWWSMMRGNLLSLCRAEWPLMRGTWHQKWSTWLWSCWHFLSLQSNPVPNLRLALCLNKALWLARNFSTWNIWRHLLITPHLAARLSGDMNNILIKSYKNQTHDLFWLKTASKVLNLAAPLWLWEELERKPLQ